VSFSIAVRLARKLILFLMVSY